MPKLWLEMTRPSRVSRFKAAIKTKPSAGIVVLGVDGDRSNDFALRSLIIINSAGHPADFFSKAK
jgi:hypothetical protein